MTTKDKLKVLEQAAAALEKQHGEGSVMRLGSKKIQPIDVIPTGIFDLDHYVLGVGGVPRARITEIYGPEAGGKTTLALQLVAAVQQAGGTAAYIDAEHSLDPSYAEKLGADVKNLFISQPDTGEQGLEIADGIIDTGACDILVVDSVAALVPKAELDGEMSDAHVGLQARMMGKALRKLTGRVRNTNTTLIFINQVREKIGVMFGSPETTPGGKALKFYASVRLAVRTIGQLKDGEQPYGATTKIEAVKNKLSTPKRKCEVEMIYGKGFDGPTALIDAASRYGVVEKSGSWFSYKAERIGQGKTNAANFIRERADMRVAIEAATLEAKAKAEKKEEGK